MKKTIEYILKLLEGLVARDKLIIHLYSKLDKTKNELNICEEMLQNLKKIEDPCELMKNVMRI